MSAAVAMVVPAAIAAAVVATSAVTAVTAAACVADLSPRYYFVAADQLTLVNFSDFTALIFFILGLHRQQGALVENSITTGAAPTDKRYCHIRFSLRTVVDNNLEAAPSVALLMLEFDKLTTQVSDGVLNQVVIALSDLDDREKASFRDNARAHVVWRRATIRLFPFTQPKAHGLLLH